MKEVHIGNARGRIAIWCDESDALEMASRYTYPDEFGREILEAVEQAYPKEVEDDEPRLGIFLTVSRA